MRYWVYGVDGVSREPREPLFIEAENEEAARRQAKEMGMAVEAVEAVPARGELDEQQRLGHVLPPVEAVGAMPARTEAITARPPAVVGPPPNDHPVASALVTVFRVLAVVCGILTLIAVSAAMEVAPQPGAPRTVLVLDVILRGVVVVSVLLAVAEGLRLGIAIERNTRGSRQPGVQDKPGRRGG